MGMTLPIKPNTMKKTIEEVAEEYSRKVNGDYFDQLYTNCDETFGQVTITEFIAGAKYQSEQIMQCSCSHPCLDDYNQTYCKICGFDILGHKKNRSNQIYSDMQEYAEFCIRCHIEGLPLLSAKDWFIQYKSK